MQGRLVTPTRETGQWSSTSPRSTKRSPQPSPTASASCGATGASRYAEVAERTRRLANLLAAAGLGAQRDRGDARRATSPARTTSPSTSTTATSTSRACSARTRRGSRRSTSTTATSPRSSRYLLNDARRRAIVYHARVRADARRGAAPTCPTLEVLLQVADDSGNALLPGARRLRGRRWRRVAEPPAARRASPDDLYILYTGGTTGMPKGVLWRQADIFVGGHGRPELGTGDECDVARRARRRGASGGGASVMPGAAVHARRRPLDRRSSRFTGGSTVVHPGRRRPPRPGRRAGARSSARRCNVLLIVGDAFARPLLDELETRRRTTSSTLLHRRQRRRAADRRRSRSAFLELLPDADDHRRRSARRRPAARRRQMSVDGHGATTGDVHARARARASSTRTSTRVLAPGARRDRAGWRRRAACRSATSATPSKTARTFPVIDGVRYSVPGDRARLTGRRHRSSCSAATRSRSTPAARRSSPRRSSRRSKHHPAVVRRRRGRPAERALGPGGRRARAAPRRARRATEDELLEEAGKHIARYKLPKAFVFVDEIVRTPERQGRLPLGQGAGRRLTAVGLATSERPTGHAGAGPSRPDLLVGENARNKAKNPAYGWSLGWRSGAEDRATTSDIRRAVCTPKSSPSRCRRRADGSGAGWRPTTTGWRSAVKVTTPRNHRSCSFQTTCRSPRASRAGQPKHERGPIPEPATLTKTLEQGRAGSGSP